MPPADNPPEGPSGTPVPPRGGKKKKKGQARPGSGPGGAKRSGGARPSAAERTEATRRAAAVAEQRRRNTLLAVATVGAVIVVVAVLVIVKATGATKATAADTTSAGIYQPVTPAEYQQLTSVQASTLASAAKDYHDPGAEIALSYPQPISASAYSVAGKPGGFYVGAEYCPYCATQRWPLVIALSKFGTWSGLETMKSSGTDVFPDTPTMTFLHATYRSKYFGFNHWELETRNPNTSLQKPSSEAQSLFDKYSLKRGIPFVYLDGKYGLLARSCGFGVAGGRRR